jgi:hypothetical protein
LDKDKDSRLIEFLDELQARARPPLPVKFARTLVVKQWGTKADQDPAKDARDWLKVRPLPPSDSLAHRVSYPDSKLTHMKPTEFHLWMICEKRTGKMRRTRDLMTELTALQRHPEAVKDCSIKVHADLGSP